MSNPKLHVENDDDWPSEVEATPAFNRLLDDLALVFRIVQVRIGTNIVALSKKGPPRPV